MIRGSADIVVPSGSSGAPGASAGWRSLQESGIDRSRVVWEGWRRIFAGVAIVAGLLATTVEVQATAGEQQARAAIIAAVRARLGAGADVHLDDLLVRGEFTAPLVAVVPPGAKTGGRIRFALTSARSHAARVGEAEAFVSVSMPHFRASQPMSRGVDIAADTLVEQVGDVGSVPLSPLPNRAALSGAMAARDIAEGEVLTGSALRLAALVKSGDKVVVHVALRGLDIQATVVAAQSGHLGDLIRCVNPETRHTMMVRVMGRGIGEVGLEF